MGNAPTTPFVRSRASPGGVRDGRALVKSITRVVQPPWPPNGCGIACVAMLAGVSFATALRTIQWVTGDAQWNRSGVFMEEMRDALIFLGCCSEMYAPRCSDDLRSPSIILLGTSYEETAHGVVCLRDAGAGWVLDPHPNSGERSRFSPSAVLYGKALYVDRDANVTKRMKLEMWWRVARRRVGPIWTPTVSVPATAGSHERTR